MRREPDTTLPIEERLFTVGQIAAGYQVSTKTVTRWIAAGLPAVNLGSAQRADWRLRWPQVRAWLEARNGRDDPA